MPTLVLPPRFTPDSNAVRAAALRAGWAIERLAGWRVPSPIDDPVLYGEPLFAAVVAPQLGLALLEPSDRSTRRAQRAAGRSSASLPRRP